jgi:hypothetical protein
MGGAQQTYADGQASRNQSLFVVRGSMFLILNFDDISWVSCRQQRHERQTCRHFIEIRT